MGYSKSSSKREGDSNTGLSQETRKISNKQPNLPLQELEKKKQKVQSQRRKEINTIKEEIIKIKIKKQ